MSEAVVVGIISIAIGLIVCLSGYVALRVIIALLGAWVGFLAGAALVAAVTDGGFLAATLAWVVAIIGAVVLGLLAYAFYQAAVLLGLGAIGFSIAVGVMAAIGIDSSVVVWLVGCAAAVLLIVLGLALDLPAALLVVLTALAGANMTLTGVMLLTGDLGMLAVETGVIPDDLPLWSGIAVIVLAIVGILVQSRGLARARMREAWQRQAAPR